MSRPSVRSGLEALESMGVVVSRRGAGNFIADGPPDLGVEPLSLLASLHRFTPNEMFEARLVLEVGVAGLAARHATGEPLAAMADEVTEMFASLGDPRRSSVHDVRFHRAVASGCGNRVLAALMEMVAAQFYELRKETIDERARPARVGARCTGASSARSGRGTRPRAARHDRAPAAGPARPDARGAAGRARRRAIGGASVGHPSLELTGKVAVVLGGTAGIGRALSLGMAEAGADVVACARTAETVEATAKEIEARGRRTVRATADVTDRASLEKARDAVLAAFGKVDILVNCAGRIKRTRGPRPLRGGVGRHPRDEPHRHAAGLPGLRPAHDRARATGAS